MRKLNIEPSTAKTMEKTTKKEKQPKSALEAFERIVEHVHNSALDDQFFKNAALPIAYASEKLGLSSMQAVLLSVFVDKSEDYRIKLSEIASFINVRTLRILQLADDVDVLVEKGYLKSSKRREDQTYRVPAQALEALRQNKPYAPKNEPVVDIQDFFDRFKAIMREKDNDELLYKRLEERTFELLEGIEDSSFVRQLKRHSLDRDDKMLFIFMAHLWVENNDDNIRFGDIEDLYDDSEIPGYVKRSLRNHTHILFDENLIENVNEDGMARSDAFKLTDKAKTELLGEINPGAVGKSDADLIKPLTIVEKKLIYNATEQSQIKELGSILSEKRFKDVQSRLKESGMRSGFCCLFYGSPGTGKTETVYQIARATGRSILRVDVDKIKSCWVGESEKNIKALFDRYRNICNNNDLAPILLFNEADAVLGVRMEGASRAVDKMENSIQNIILQEMESLEGIMIATTNLTSNLDKAFERRFLYKVKFEKPSIESRAAIWRAMLPGLKVKDAKTLASRFDLSGGEIENVVRRHTVKSILSGTPTIDLTSIEESCTLERLSTTRTPRIGF